jgi:hypothetical protein
MEKPPRRPRVRVARGTVLGWVAVMVILALVAGIAIVLWNEPKRNAEAKTKAQQLYDDAVAAGIRLPDEERSVKAFESLFGTDGGAAVETAASNLSQAQLLYDTGRPSGEVSQRPGPIDTQLLEFQYLVLGVYAPEKQAEFEEFVNGIEDQDTL